MTLPNRAPGAGPSRGNSPGSACSSDTSRAYEDATAATLLTPPASIHQDIASTLQHLEGDAVWAAMAELFASADESPTSLGTAKYLADVTDVLKAAGPATRGLCGRYLAALDRAMDCSSRLPSPGKAPLKKRANLSKHAKHVLRTWFDAHFHHPYPSDDEKTALSVEGGITIDQVNNWFINTRVREWKPQIHKVLAQNAAGDSRILDAMLDKVKAPYKL
ncbi:hypothetical protein ACHHYP_00647 [Achlya hypogyna]|uniref:Homeobox domain-containing protein n=1 Tax=Achlya hypogyna TaxID=1202772 RepID=A0A1V9ZAN4_ACHHY|nr:hypothetical protein ACHHYP_00647 [Achlya hypogyna]